MIDAPRRRLRHIVSASGRIMATVFSPSDENKQKAKNIGRLVDDKEEILLQKDSDDSSETVGSVISNSQLVKISQRRDESQACGEHEKMKVCKTICKKLRLRSANGRVIYAQRQRVLLVLKKTET